MYPNVLREIYAGRMAIRQRREPIFLATTSQHFGFSFIVSVSTSPCLFLILYRVVAIQISNPGAFKIDVFAIENLNFKEALRFRRSFQLLVEINLQISIFQN